MFNSQYNFIFLLPLIISSLLLLFFSLFVLNSDKKSLQHILFSCLSASTGLWFFSFIFMYSAINQTNAHFFAKLGYSWIILIPLFLSGYTNSYVGKKITSTWIKISMLISVFFLLINTFSNSLISGVYQYQWGFYPKAGILLYFFIVFFIVSFCFSFIEFINFYKKQSSNNSIYLFLAFFIALLGGVDYFANYGINIYPLGYFFATSCIAIVAYAILKHELMDIRLAVTKTFSYLISISLLCVSFLFPLLLINHKLLLLVVTITLSVFWAFYFRPLASFLITTTKRKFIKGYYEPAKVLLTISDMLVSKTDRESIFFNVLNTLDEALELEQSSFIVAVRDKENKLQGYKLLNEENSDLTELSTASPLIDFFKANQSIYKIENLEDELRALLLEMNYTKNSLVFPLHSPELLEGILLLGKRSSGKDYKETDVNFLKQLRAILTSAFYKLTPYEKIEKNFLGTQKKLYDAERNLARTERIASLANLIQEYNHEIKTPLAVLVGILDNSDLPEDKKKKAFAQTSRIGDIVRTTLRLSSNQEGERENLNINEVIKQALDILPLSGVSIKKQLNETPNISGHSDDLQIMITNLMQNAREAMPEGGDLTIKTSSEVNTVIISITDTGCGISKEIQDKIFEPFFSTHVTKGRGLGLSIVFRVVREHLGTIEFKSETGKGTTFTIKLPMIPLTS